MLERELDFQTQFRYHLINSIAGRIGVDDLLEASQLPGVVLIELDGILTTQMNDVNDVHGIPMIWEDTGYTGEGSVVSIIDTGIDRIMSGWTILMMTTLPMTRRSSRSTMQ